MKPKMLKRKQSQQGAVMILVALMAVVVFGMTAFAIDIGRAMVVRNELQNAADGAALAGARALGTNYLSPSWSLAEAAASAAVARNSSEGIVLSDAGTTPAQAGYWNVGGSPATMQATTITPGPSDRPAVRVTVSRSAGNNGGPMRMFFAPVLGIFNIPVSATAVAVISAPGAANPGALLPIAISKCLYDTYWDATTGMPKSGTPSFDIISSIHTGPCHAGQWTTFDLVSTNVPTVRDLIANGNPTTLSIGDPVWIQPGTKNTLFDEIPINRDYLLVVVADSVLAGNNATTTPILAFSSFHVESTTGGSCKCVTGHMIAGFTAPDTSGNNSGSSGSYYGAVTPPVLTK